MREGREQRFEPHPLRELIANAGAHDLGIAKGTIAARECDLFGHDTFTTISTAMRPAPTHVMCDRCGKTWAVQQEATGGD